MCSPEILLGKLWRAWQRGVPPAGDLEWQTRYDAFVEVLRSSRARNIAQPVAAFLAGNAQAMWEAIRRQPGMECDDQTVELYRGLANEAAQDAQLDLLEHGCFPVHGDGPISYSLHHGVALSFARKSYVPGLIYSARIRREDVAFFDLWGGAGNLDVEREVVVWHSSAMSVTADEVRDRRVQAAIPTTSRSVTQERQRFLEDRRLRLCKERGLDGASLS